MLRRALSLLVRRRDFRRVWLAAGVSLFGDWFSLLATYQLILSAHGGGVALGAVLLARQLPQALLGPLAGVVADLLPRRLVMVACDLLRAVVVLGYCFLEPSVALWPLYALTVVQYSLSALFDPAEQAALGTVVERDEIVDGMTIHAATWSAMLSVGALAGGGVGAFWGVKTAFVIDALSYLVSAALLFGVKLPPPPSRLPGTSALRLGLSTLADGLAFLRSRPDVARVLLVKAGWSAAGGAALLMYTVLGDQDFRLAGTAAAGIGVLLSMRGLGAMLGPFLARTLGGDTEPRLERGIFFAFCCTAFFYVAFSMAPTLWIGAACLFGAHLGISTQWVFSSSLLNLRVEDRFKGRVFAVDFMISSLFLALSSLAGGALLDLTHLPARTIMFGLGVALLVPAFLWRSLTQPRVDAATAPSQSAGGGAR